MTTDIIATLQVIIYIVKQGNNVLLPYNNTILLRCLWATIKLSALWQHFIVSDNHELLPKSRKTHCYLWAPQQNVIFVKEFFKLQICRKVIK